MLKLSEVDDVNSCEICHKTKQSGESFPFSSHKFTVPFDLIHVDVWGPYSVKSNDGSKYFFTLVDDFSRAT